DVEVGERGDRAGIQLHHYQVVDAVSVVAMNGNDLAAIQRQTVVNHIQTATQHGGASTAIVGDGLKFADAVVVVCIDEDKMRAVYVGHIGKRIDGHRRELDDGAVDGDRLRLTAIQRPRKKS